VHGSRVVSLGEDKKKKESAGRLPTTGDLALLVEFDELECRELRP